MSKKQESIGIDAVEEISKLLREEIKNDYADRLPSFSGINDAPGTVGFSGTTIPKFTPSQLASLSLEIIRPNLFEAKFLSPSISKEEGTFLTENVESFTINTIYKYISVVFSVNIVNGDLKLPKILNKLEKYNTDQDFLTTLSMHDNIGNVYVKFSLFGCQIEKFDLLNHFVENIKTFSYENFEPTLTNIEIKFHYNTTTTDF